VNLLLASSELFPYSKTGGLADMVGALGKALANAGETVSTVTPLYAGIREKHPGIEATAMEFELPLGRRMVKARVWKKTISERLAVYFVEQPEFFERAGLYVEAGANYTDNAERFIFFSKCVVHLAREFLHPDIIHVHDWQVGLAPLLFKHEQRIAPRVAGTATVLTIHNLAFQGVFPYSDWGYTNLPDEYYTPEGVEFYGYFNCLKAGIVHSEMITTVSPRYAREILTEQFGCGLDGVLRGRQEDLTGILNGVDYSEWQTEKNPLLNHPFSAEERAGKTAQKLDLQEEMGLPKDAEIPLFATISRLADQKGFDILLPALEEMISARMQFVVLGSGDADFEAGLKLLAARHPEKVAIHIGYNHALSHRIEAGADFFLMPSRFEPCGLNQMYSLRYGTIPVVRVTGGLDDSVVDISEDAEMADGIKFFEYTPRALAKAIRKALALYESKELMAHYQRNAMEADFSWEHTSAEYIEVYQQALQQTGRKV
jgi:starch synthase